MLPSWRSIMDEPRELWHVKPLRGAEEEEQSGRQEWEEDSDGEVWEGRFQTRYCGVAKTRPFTVVGLQRFGASSDIWCIMIELMLKSTFRITHSMWFTGSLVGAASCQTFVGLFINRWKWVHKYKIKWNCSLPCKNNYIFFSFFCEKGAILVQFNKLHAISEKSAKKDNF